MPYIEKEDMMHTIKQYLDNLFLGLPETPQVLRAKAELLEMMEDKYEELLADGKSEQEAVGIVISEFGSLEELADELGIEGQLQASGNDEEAGEKATGESVPESVVSNEDTSEESNHFFWSQEKLEKYVAYIWKHAYLIGFGVALFIASTFMDSISDLVPSFVPAIGLRFFTGFLGTGLFGAMICAGIILCVSARNLRKEQVNIEHVSIILDGTGVEYLREKRKADEEKCYKFCFAGIACIILGTLPGSLSEFIPFQGIRSVFEGSFLLFVALGVMLLIFANSVKNRYKELDAVTSYVEAGSYQRVFEGYESPKMSGKAKTVLILSAVAVIVINIWISLFFGLILESKSIFETGKGSIEEIYNAGSDKETVDGSFDVQDVKKIKIDFDVADVVIKTADVDEANYSFSGYGALKKSIDKETGTIHFKSGSVHGFFSFIPILRDTGKLTLTLPQDGSMYWKDYDIHVDTGKVQMNGVVAQNVSIEVDAGNVQMQENSFETLKMEVDAGNVTLYNTEASHKLSCDVDAGNVKVETTQAKDYYMTNHQLTLENDLGKITVFGTNYDKEHLSFAPSGQQAQGAEVVIDLDMGEITFQNK